jgi:hypothetical protein
MQNKVQIFIVGAAKCGTTFLANTLSTFTGITLGVEKEPHYFSKREIYPSKYSANNYIDTLEGYKNNYRKVTNASQESLYKIDASPSYLWSLSAAEQIFQYNPEARIIIILRDPVQRAFSHYLMDCRYGVQKEAFMDALKSSYGRNELWGRDKLYIELSDYIPQVDRFFKIFSQDQVKLINFNRLKENNIEIISDILSFIQYDRDYTINDLNNALCQDKFSYQEVRFSFIKRFLANDFLRFIFRNLFSKKLRRFLRNHFLFKKALKPELSSQAADFILEKIGYDWSFIEKRYFTS